MPKKLVLQALKEIPNPFGKHTEQRMKAKLELEVGNVISSP